MLPPDEAHREIDNLASLILPALEERLKVDVGLIEERACAPTLQVTDLRRRLISTAEKVYDHILLGGTPPVVIGLVERVEAAVGKTPANLKLEEVFARTYNGLRKQERRREAAVRRATTNETRVRAIALDDAYSRVQAEPNASFAGTLIGLRIRSLVEDTRIEFEDAAATLEQYEEEAGEPMGPVGEALQEEQRAREQTEEAARAEQEGQGGESSGATAA